MLMKLFSIVKLSVADVSDKSRGSDFLFLLKNFIRTAKEIFLLYQNREEMSYVLQKHL